jgi:phosphoribosyl 1,2-cyclic phosphodiesterase
MPFQIAVLASGSSGNSTFLSADDFGLLLDIGIGPRLLSSRLASVGRSWDHVQAVLLSHTHSDHWNERTLKHLVRRGVPLYCHDEHHAALLQYGCHFAKLRDGGQVRSFCENAQFELGNRLGCRPLLLSHDCVSTYGFRFDWLDESCQSMRSLAYLADLGHWTPELVGEVSNVDLLALECNHDVELEYASGRSPLLIARVLGDQGHLSNAQAAAFLHELLRVSQPGRLQQIVQLHLSRDCNHPDLARTQIIGVLRLYGVRVDIHTAGQHFATPLLTVGQRLNVLANHYDMDTGRPGSHVRPVREGLSSQRWLPGWEF